MDRNPHAAARRLIRDLLIQARKAAGLRQQDVAEKLKKPQSFVSKYESVERRVDLAELVEICTAIGVRTSSFVAQFEQAQKRKKQG